MVVRRDTADAILRVQAQSAADRTFVRFFEDTLSFGQLDASATDVARLLQDLGCRRGDVISSLMPNGLDALRVWFGVGRAGMVHAPVNLGYRGTLLAYLLTETASEVLIATEGNWRKLVAIREQLPQVRKVLVDDADLDEARTELGADLVVALHSALRSVSGGPEPAPPSGNDPSAVIFTSGTTGPSKGVLRSHAGDVRYADAAVELMQYSTEDVHYVAFPLFHGFARYNGILPLLMAGGTVVLRPRFSTSEFWEVIGTERATTFNFLGATAQMLLNLPPGSADREHTLVKGHGAPASKEMIRQFDERFGVRLLESYGSSEMGIVVANRPFRAGAAGRPIGSYDVEIRNDDGAPLPPGDVGEIVVRPRGESALFMRYLGPPELTTQAFDRGWFLSGDLGSFDEDGWLHFVDRKKDAIRRRGENISSWEIETVVSRHPSVAEVAAFGVASDLSEEEVAIAVVLKQGETTTAAALLDHCRRHLPPYAVPRYVRLLDDLPKTPTAKVEKFRLRQAGVTGAWDGARP